MIRRWRPWEVSTTPPERSVIPGVEVLTVYPPSVNDEESIWRVSSISNEQAAFKRRDEFLRRVITASMALREELAFHPLWPRQRECPVQGIAQRRKSKSGLPLPAYREREEGARDQRSRTNPSARV